MLISALCIVITLEVLKNKTFAFINVRYWGEAHLLEISFKKYLNRMFRQNWYRSTCTWKIPQSSRVRKIKIRYYLLIRVWSNRMNWGNTFNFTKIKNWFKECKALKIYTVVVDRLRRIKHFIFKINFCFVIHCYRFQCQPLASYAYTYLEVEPSIKFLWHFMSVLDVNR